MSKRNRTTPTVLRQFFEAIQTTVRVSKNNFNYSYVKKISKKISRKIIVGAGALVFGLVLFGSYLFFAQPEKVAAWFDYNWTYRVIYILTNSSTAIASERKIKLDIDTATLISAGKLQNDCDDARFTDQDGKVLEYFIDTSVGACNTNSTDFYVKAASIPTNTFSVLFYYGNPSATQGRSPDFFAQDTLGQGLVAYYPMNEATANTCSGGSNDTCDYASTNDGSWNGNATYTANGKAGGGTTYDGTGDYVDTNNINLTGAFTASAWIYNTGSTGTYIVFGEDSGSGAGPKIGISVQKVFVRIIAGSLDNTITEPTLNTWHHFVITRDENNKVDYYSDGGSANRLFSDAAQVGTFTLDILGANGGSLDQSWNGSLDDIRLYNRALSAPEISAIYNAGNPSTIPVPLTFTPSATSAQSEEKSPGPVGAWNFDEASGTTLKDSTQQANHGAFLTGVPISTGLSQQIELLNRNYTSNTTTFNPTDNSSGLAYYDSSKYTSPTAYFEAIIRQNQTNTTSNDVGQVTAVDCPSADNCKVAYYDWTTSSIRFMDCDDATCSSGTVTVIDGTTGCAPTGCVTTEQSGDYIALDCVSSDDCKIAYMGGSTDLMFVDCSSESCSSGTRTIVDGVAGCALTGCASRTTALYVSLDCSSGGTDCKIGYISSAGDVYFADCDTATCSSGTVTMVDGGASCPLTGCNTAITSAANTAIYCLSSTDCKLIYHSSTGGDLIFADCDNATCSSGTATVLDGAAACPLTGCSTSDTVGTSSSLYCSATDDCKISYFNTTDTDLYFADCSTATCSSGTTTLIEGNTGCAVSGCITTGSSGFYTALDCIGGSTDCKIAFYRSTTDDLRFTDCDNAACSSGTVTLLDGNSGCTLTSCATAASLGQNLAFDCPTASDCKVAYYQNDLDDILFADCNNATCSSGSTATTDGDGALKNVVGYFMDVDCTAGASDCKIAYYDTTESALIFFDCDNATCSSGTTVYLDGKDGCTLTGCVTTADAGSYVALDCSNGANDCKISYYVDGSTDDLYFADCDSATCNVGTTRMIDGGASCPLTGCTTSAIVGTHTNIDCSAGSSDCKIVYKNESTDDLLFADCDTATCSTGTRTVVDGNTGCALTGCSTTNNMGINAALSCVSSTDCKITYYDSTRTALRFADCDNATCSSGTASLLEGDTGCTLTSCSTTNSSGLHSSLDCSPGADNCKITYFNSTGNDLNFVDCSNATCTSGTISQLEGSSGCTLTNCSTSAFVDYPTIFCGGDGANCKVAYYRTNDFSFADCDNEACSSGTTTVLDGTSGCPLTGCSTNTFDTVFSLDCNAGMDDCKVAYYENDNGDVYFADCNNATCSSGTTNLTDDGADRVWIQLVSSAGTHVADGILTTKTNSYTRLRTPAISPTTATSYGIRVASTDSVNITADVSAARMIVSQSGTLTASQTQVELGNYETSTATSYTQLTNKKIYRYDANKFTPTPSTYFEATISNSTAGQTTSVALYSDGASCSTVVSGSEVAVTGTTWARVRSSAITLSDDTDYMICIKTTANTAQIANARVILDQSSTIYGTELVYNLVNTARTDADTTYTTQNGLNYFDPALFSGSTNYYFESDIKTSAGTGYAQLYNATDASAVSSSEVSTTGTSYSRQRSNALTMPVAAKNLDTQIKNSSTNTTTVTSADLIIQAGSPPTSEPTRRTSESCYSNNCLEFNGSDNSVSISNTAVLDLDQGLAAGVTFAGWVKVSSDGENNVGQIVSKGDTTYLRTTNEDSDRLVDLEASLDLASSDATVTISNGLPLNEWHHVAIGYSDDGDDEIVVYIDGQLRGTSSNGSGAPASDGNDWLIGGSSAANFHGFIDEARLYSYERSAAQLKLDYTAKGTTEGVSAQLGGNSVGDTLSQGLVAYYPMDEATANTCTNGTNDTCDMSGNGNDGAWNGNATSGAGKYGNGTTFDGTGDYVADSNGLGTLSNTITIAGWIKPSALGTTRKAVIANEGIFKLDIDTDSKVRFLTGENWGGSLLKNNTALTTGAWYFITATYDGTTKKVYLNGVLDSSITNTTGSIGTSTNLYLADYGANLNPFAGQLDEVRIYNRALSPAEVSTLYNWAPGPVAHWELDENTGTSASDASLNNNTGTLTNGPAWASGKLGSGVKFDGSDDYIEVDDPSDNSFDVGTGNFAITAWAKVEPNTSGGVVVKGFWAGGSNGFFLYTRGIGSYPFAWWNGSTAIEIGENDGNWHHLAVVREGTDTNQVKVYLDGVQTATGTDSRTLSNSDALRIGASIDDGYLNGHVDDVRIYNYPLTQKQIINVMNGREAHEPAIGGSIGHPVLHLSFDGGSGTTAQDSSPQNNDGTLTNMAAPATSTSGWSNSGKFGKALAFDGSDDYVSASNNSSARIDGKSFSISSWVKRGAINSNQFIISKGDETAGTNAFHLGFTNTNTVRLGFYGDDTDTTRTFTDTTNWYHILTTYDSISGSQKIYINGILEKSDTAAVLSGTDDDNWGVGRKEYNDSEYFNGLIDEVKIYPYALSEDEIKLEYNRGAAIVAGSTSTASNGTTPDNSAAREYCVPGDTSTCNPPVAEWKFDENTGTTANDSSGNNNTGTLTTSPTWTTGKTGSGVNLSPSNSYVSVADSSSLNITGDLTISTWVKPNAVDSTARLIMGKGNTSATTSRQYGMRLSAANQWQAFVYSGSTTYSVADTTTTPSTSRWDQLTVVRDATANTLKFYTNGILRGSASSVTGSLNSTNNIFAIGREGSSASNYFGGMVDNMRIYNYARTPAQVAWEYNRGGPIAHYKLDECQGTTANNSALFGSETAGNNGTITIGASGSNTSVGSCKGSGGEAWKTGASGKFNSSLSFDGTDDYLDIPDTTQLNFSTTTPYSLSVWVQKASDGVTQVVLDKRTAENTGYSIFIGSDNQVYFRSTNLTDLVSTATITGTDWHHLLVTDNRGGTRQLFIDGQLAASDNVTTSSNSLSATTTLRLARNSTAGIGNYYFAGQIDDVRIYNYPLTALQIKDIYTGGAVNFR